MDAKKDKTERRKDAAVVIALCAALTLVCIVVMAMMCNGNGILTCAG